MFQARPKAVESSIGHPLSDFPPAAPVKAQALIDETAIWLPHAPLCKSAYFGLYRIWHGRVRSEYTAHATPGFLFLLAIIPILTKARDELQSLTLWDPPEGPLRTVRDNQPAWRRYKRFLPRIEQSVAEVGPYADVQLPGDLDSLLEKLTAAESAFRDGPPAGL